MTDPLTDALTEDDEAELPPEPDDSEPPPVARAHEIEVTYITPDGERKDAVVVHRVPSLEDSLRIGRLAARMRRGVPRDALDDYTNDIVDMTAYLSVALVEMPPWLGLGVCVDPGALIALYQEGQRHTARFLGRGANLAAGSGEGG